MTDADSRHFQGFDENGVLKITGNAKTAEESLQKAYDIFGDIVTTWNFKWLKPEEEVAQEVVNNNIVLAAFSGSVDYAIECLLIEQEHCKSGYKEDEEHKDEYSRRVLELTRGLRMLRH